MCWYRPQRPANETGICVLGRLYSSWILLLSPAQLKELSLGTNLAALRSAGKQDRPAEGFRKDCPHGHDRMRITAPAESMKSGKGRKSGKEIGKGTGSVFLCTQWIDSHQLRLSLQNASHLGLSRATFSTLWSEAIMGGL